MHSLSSKVAAFIKKCSSLGDKKEMVRNDSSKILGNSNDNYGRKVDKNGKYGITSATITIFEGNLIEDDKTSKPKHKGLTLEQAIGAVAGHEIIHATDKSEIDKDI